MKNFNFLKSLKGKLIVLLVILFLVTAWYRFLLAIILLPIIYFVKKGNRFSIIFSGVVSLLLTFVNIAVYVENNRDINGYFSSSLNPIFLHLVLFALILVSLIKVYKDKENKYDHEKSADKKIDNLSNNIQASKSSDKSVKEINKKENGNKRKLKIIVIFTVVILLLVVLLKINNQDSIVKTDKSISNEEIIENLYRNTKYNFRIKFPNNWEIQSGDGPNIIKKAVGEGGTISVGVREINSNKNNNLTIKDVFTIDEFLESGLDEIKVSFPGAVIADYGETKIDNKPVYWFKYDASYSALETTVDLTILHYVLLYNNIFYFIDAGTSSDNFATLESTLKESVSTLVIEEY